MCRIYACRISAVRTRVSMIALFGVYLTYLIYMCIFCEAPTTSLSSTSTGKTVTMFSKTLLTAKLATHKAFAKESTIHKPYQVYLGGGPGRFGNKMFMYAAGYAIARTNNRTAFKHGAGFIILEHLFARLSVRDSSPLASMRTIKEAKYATYDPRFETLPKHNVKLKGYFQSWKYFQKYEHDLRTEFTFNGAIRKEATDHLLRIAQRYTSRLLSANVTFIGVHIRRGDKVRSRTHLVAGKSYFVRAMNAFRRNFTRVHFVVCSDDIRWCKLNLGNQRDVSFSENRSLLVDFAILSLCNHTVTSVGTFSWWVGWMAGGVTTYYKHFAHNTSFQYRDLKVADHFLPHWIPMSD